MKRWLVAGIVILSVIVLDQVTKRVASHWGAVTLNAGVAFGLADEVGLFLNMLGLIAIGIWLMLEKSWQRRWALSGMWAGGVSNWLDRWWWGGVRDWLPIPFTNLHNNLADYAVMLGLLAWVYLMVRHHDET